jgi:hypothetical protein
MLFIFSTSHAQVNSVEFGKNRVQYQKFNWQYYQTENFNSYFSQDGMELGKYVAQIAENELPDLETFIEYGLQRRANIVVYNNFNEMQQSNIGIGIDWQTTGGVTKLVNNKMLVYFDANRNNLRRQVRQGIAQVLVQNMLFGDNLGEFAANQTLLDLPKWLTDGYIAYAAETWSTELDNQLKSAMLSGRYNNFYQFAFEKPQLAGHAFWHYFGNKYGRNKTTYLLYLARIYRNLNNASQRITKTKFKNVLQEFMREQTDLYYKDIRGRRTVPRGQLSVTEEIGKKDFIRFNANPQPRSFTYAVVEYKRGKYSVVLQENMVDRKVLLKFGARSREDEVNPNYPILAWDGKGTRLAVVYSEESKIKLFVYDVVSKVKTTQKVLPEIFDQVQDMKYMLNPNTLLFSAVQNGHTDIFVYEIDKGTTEQITNDVYDDLDPSFVAFPGKTGIIFSSNRPDAEATSSDTSMPAPNFNIFLVDNWNKTEFKQISQLSNVRFGNARHPTQYNTSHFTFVSDENGINNRYAGFFRTERAGLDTLVYIAGDIFRNPTGQEVDSILKELNKPDIDSVSYFSVTNDSSYVFPLSNYQASLLETRTAGDNSLVSEVIRQGDVKFLYRLRVDENTLRRRNINARPTEYVRKRMMEERAASGRATLYQPLDSVRNNNDIFQNEFESEFKDTTASGELVREEPVVPEPVIRRAKLFQYRPPKFYNDYLVAGLNNTVFVPSKYMPYAGGAGPINPANGNQLNGLIRMGTTDLFEDYKLSGGFRIAPNLRDNDVLFELTNLRKRLDIGFTYYRSSNSVEAFESNLNTALLAKTFANYYLVRLRYAIDRVRSVRATIGPRFDNLVITSDDRIPITLLIPDQKKTFGQLGFEYVHDNTINPTINIWNGLRWKTYIDWFTQINKIRTTDGRFMFNAGIDARNYLPIYRNVIWAVRGAADFSWGNQKVIYYLGGVDGWLKIRENVKTENNNFVGYRYFEAGDANRPDPDQDYAYQALAVNLRGFKQNVANGNNAMVINSEIRMPVFSTLLNRPINNALLRNFQLVQFVDLGAAWNGKYDKIRRPSVAYGEANNPVAVRIKAGGIGPFAGGYGFGARSTLLGYFVRFDAAWQMNGIFEGKPQLYLALGVDF